MKQSRIIKGNKLVHYALLPGAPNTTNEDDVMKQLFISETPSRLPASQMFLYHRELNVSAFQANGGIKKHLKTSFLGSARF